MEIVILRIGEKRIVLYSNPGWKRARQEEAGEETLEAIRWNWCCGSENSLGMSFCNEWREIGVNPGSTHTLDSGEKPPVFEIHESRRKIR